jgi:pyrroloquinoline quinone biosynthesis protein D
MNNPEKIDTVAVEVLGDELCVYDRASKRVHALNPTAARVWQLCDGTRSPTDIAQLLSSEFGALDADALVTLTLEELDKGHLLRERGTPAGAMRTRLTRRRMIAGATATLVGGLDDRSAPGRRPDGYSYQYTDQHGHGYGNRNQHSHRYTD